jgi:membrane-bound metal-dependent hydrolase YbcI (DUF457 family)
MNSKVHATTGAVFGIGTYCIMKEVLKEKPTFIGCVSSGLAGAVIAGIPDYMEPATSGHHRSFFHSIAVLIILGYIAFRYLKGDKLNADAKTILAVVLSSYGSHLALDSLTPAGLPMA